MAFQKLEQAFMRYIGPDCMETLKSQMSDRPAILLGGDQLTGKSTMSKKLASYFPGGQMFSAGVIFREQAAVNGMTVGHFSKTLLEQLQDPNSERRFDVDTDFRSCVIIAGKEFTHAYSVVEGRQPAVMGRFLGEKFGKRNTFRIYLTCNPRERAVRFIEREFGTDSGNLVNQALPLVHDAYADFSSSKIGELIGQLEIPNGNTIAATFIDNQRRDLDDRARYIDLYGMDYRDLQHYDLVVDTSGRPAEENFSYTLSEFRARAPHIWDILNTPV